MGGYGENFPYGASKYKDENEEQIFEVLAIEPVILLTFENRAFTFSHRSDVYDRREYRLTEFLKRGQYADKFIFGA